MTTTTTTTTDTFGNKKKKKKEKKYRNGAVAWRGGCLSAEEEKAGAVSEGSRIRRGERGGREEGKKRREGAGGVNEGPREREGEKERGRAESGGGNAGIISISGCADGDRGRTRTEA